MKFHQSRGTMMNEPGVNPCNEHDDIKNKKYHFFWKSGSPFSQWHSSKYNLDGFEYVCAEQGMMHGKALLFEDEATANLIIETADSRKMKALGRAVTRFNEKIWKQNRENIVYRNNVAKFTQNQNLLEALMRTSGDLVEASPSDRIWGIGLNPSRAKQVPEHKWPGKNLLGKVLTRVRKDIALQDDNEGRDENHYTNQNVNQDKNLDCCSTQSPMLLANEKGKGDVLGALAMDGYITTDLSSMNVSAKPNYLSRNKSRSRRQEKTENVDWKVREDKSEGIAVAVANNISKKQAKKLKKILKQKNALREEREDQSISAINTEDYQLNKLLPKEEVLRKELNEQQTAFN